MFDPVTGRTGGKRKKTVVNAVNKSATTKRSRSSVKVLQGLREKALLTVGERPEEGTN